MILSIIITTKNRKKDLFDCIYSIKKSKNAPSLWELIIVDDNSDDGTEKLRKSDLSIQNVTIVHNKKSLMMVKSRNIGARMAKGKYVLFIDDDNIIDSRMISTLIRCAKELPRFGVLGPAMYSFYSRKKYLDNQKLNLFSGKTSGLIDSSDHEVVQSDGVPNVFLIKKEVFDRCGYFDETLVQTFTEPDFSFSILKQGFKSGIAKKAITYHKVKVEDGLSPRSLGGKFSQKAYCLMRNRTVIVARYGSLIQKIIYLSFFSWFWPLVYTILVIRQLKLNLIKLYWLGFFDGVTYLLTGKLNWSFRE